MMELGMMANAGIPADAVLLDLGTRLAPLAWGGVVWVMATLVAIVGAASREVRSRRPAPRPRESLSDTEILTDGGIDAAA